MLQNKTPVGTNGFSLPRFGLGLLALMCVCLSQCQVTGQGQDPVAYGGVKAGPVEQAMACLLSSLFLGWAT